MNVLIVDAHEEPSSFNGALLFPIPFGVFAFTGFDVSTPLISYAAAWSAQEEREAMLSDDGGRFWTWRTTAPIPFPGLAE